MVCVRPWVSDMSTQSCRQLSGVEEYPANMAGFSSIPRADITPTMEETTTLHLLLHTSLTVSSCHLSYPIDIFLGADVAISNHRHPHTLFHLLTKHITSTHKPTVPLTIFMASTLQGSALCLVVLPCTVIQAHPATSALRHSSTVSLEESTNQQVSV